LPDGAILDRIPEQDEAKRLLVSALTEGPAHAYLFHGPRGVGKRGAALAFAAELLGDEGRVMRLAHPDLYLLEPLGDQIRIDAVRELRHDLHLRPFEAGRRVYLILGADLMNEEAADALLKDLEEPPDYAVVVLVASELGRLPETIRSRCQLVPFRRLSRRALEARIGELAPDLPAEERAAVARTAAGRLDRVERLLDPERTERRAVLVEIARSAYRSERPDPALAARSIVEVARGLGERAARQDREGADGTARELEQRARRVARGAERDEVLEALDLLAGWYRDLLAVALGAGGAVLNADRLAALEEDASGIEPESAAAAAEAVAETRRTFELNVAPQLALEAMFIRLSRALRGSGARPERPSVTMNS
jgi:DNA polymerase-3 subunit delta'